MSHDTRDGLLGQLEERLKTKVITYLTSDRQNMPAQIGMDAIPRFRRHLEAIGEVESIALFIYSRGGDTNVPWRLANLIREYCKQFIAVVPFRAHSAATLICMGADKIIMGKMGELSAVDPSVANAFNPPDPTNPAARIPISVEDVNAFKDLAVRFGVEGKERNVDVFLALASKIEPLALGNVERTYNQIRKLTTDLLSMHMPETGKNGKIEEIVKTMTTGLYSHSHIVSRREAKKIGLNAEPADKTLDALMWSLFSEYAAEMELEKAFNAAQSLTGQPTARISLKRAFVESVGKTDAFVSEGSVSRVPPGAVQLPPGMQLQLPPQLQAQIQVAVNFDSEGWKVIR